MCLKLNTHKKKIKIIKSIKIIGEDQGQIIMIQLIAHSNSCIVYLVWSLKNIEWFLLNNIELKAYYDGQIDRRKKRRQA